MNNQDQNDVPATKSGCFVPLEQTLKDGQTIASKCEQQYNSAGALSKPSLKEHVHPILNTKQLPFALPWAPSFALASYLNDNYKFGVGIGVANAGGLQESCAMKSSIGFFGGAAMGGVLGIFLGAMSDMTPPVTVINGKEVPQAPVKEQMRTVIRATGEKAMYWSRNFAFITGVFTGSECIVEKARGKHDVWNAVASGCITGAAMQAKQGPQAAAVGCGGFAAFSLVADAVMGNY